MSETVDAYVRISLDPDEMKGSADNQVRALTKWCAERGWTLGEVYRDNSISATSGKTRPGFEALLSRPINRPVVVWAMDRLVRTMADLERVVDTDTTVHAMQSGAIDLSTVQGKMLARITTAVSSSEGELKAERMRLSNRARAEAGLPHWRRAPYGHNDDGSIHPVQGPVVARMVAELLAGKSMYAIARDLTTEGVQPPGKATVWRSSTLRSILTKHRVAGILMYRDERMPVSQIQPIITEADFIRVQAVANNPERKVGGSGVVTTLLSGIATCGLCGSTVEASVRLKRGGDYRPTYRCAEGKHNSHPRDETDDYVVGQLLRFITDPASSLPTPDLAERIADDMERVATALGEWEAQALDLGPAEYLRVTKPLREQLSGLERDLAALSQSDLFAPFLGADEAMWSGLHDLDAAYGVWLRLPLGRQREMLSAALSVRLDKRGNRDFGFVAERVDVSPA